MSSHMHPYWGSRSVVVVGYTLLRSAPWHRVLWWHVCQPRTHREQLHADYGKGVGDTGIQEHQLCRQAHALCQRFYKAPKAAQSHNTHTHTRVM